MGKRPKFRCQFSSDHVEVEFGKVEYSPMEGFIPNQVESLERLVQRISVGQTVPTLEDGIYASDQIFDTEFVDKFDVLDKVDELGEQVIMKNKQRPPENKTPEQPPHDPATPAP